MRARLAALLLPTLLLGGCMTRMQLVGDREDLLAAAGFAARPANTPERIAMLRRLPPDRFTTRMRGDRYLYIYPDPLVCGCVYIGDAAAYGRYRAEILQRQLADDRLMAAQMNEQAAWDWGPWGPGPFW